MIRSCIDLSDIFVRRGGDNFVRRGPDIFVGRGCPRPLSVVDGINPPLQDLLRGRVPYHVNPQIAAVHQRGQQAGHAALG